jgi:hypothetical protein
LQPDTLLFRRDFAASISTPVAGAAAVYRNTVLSGAVESLRANYPVVEQLVGEEMFAAVAVDFATECPPRSPIMTMYGERFAEWLETQPWVNELPYLPDVARVERLRIESIMAADRDPLTNIGKDAQELSALKVDLHPSARFNWLRSPGMSIWLAHQQGFTSEPKIDWKAEGVLFVRPSPFTLHSPRIGAPAHRILFGLRIGEPLHDAIAATNRLYPDADTTALLSSLLRLGVFVAPSFERN